MTVMHSAEAGRTTTEQGEVGTARGKVDARTVVMGAHGAALGISAGLIAAGLGVFSEGGVAALWQAGVVGVLLVLTLGPIGWVLTASREGEGEGGKDRAASELLEMVRQLREQVALSDDARRVLNRQSERQLLRRAIEEDIAAEDWDAAMILVKELADRFGYRQDAEEFRGRIERARAETVDRKVRDAIAYLDGLIIQRRWEAAMAEAARIGRLYPDSPRAEGLRHRVEQAQAMFKTDLERRFLTAAAEDRIDEAMELLKELDGYLTAAEAEPYREVARGVIGKARENLGVQFKLAVQDRRWAVASRVGARIIDEFPNTRMAEEVRAVIDGIRSKAAASVG